jgi:hypothetical protein
VHHPIFKFAVVLTTTAKPLLNFERGSAVRFPRLVLCSPLHFFVIGDKPVTVGCGPHHAADFLCRNPFGFPR